MKKSIMGFLLIGIIVTSVITTGCKKDDDDNNNNPPDNQTGTFTDSRDSKTYNWVKIGNQVWMAENLAYKPRTVNYWVYNNNESNVAIYGYLYSWEIAQTVAPIGWHMPSKEEWQTLVNYSGGENKAYDKLLEKGTTHWNAPNSATNESGFTALAAGYFDQRDNSFNSLAYLTMFHSSSEYPGDSTSAMGLVLNQNFQEASIEGRPKKLALSIRCVKD